MFRFMLCQKKQLMIGFGVLLMMGMGSTVDAKSKTEIPPVRWEMQAQKSHIMWEVKYAGKVISGSFPEFDADIVFDPVHLNNSAVSSKITLARVKASDKDAESTLLTKDWLNVIRTPYAFFKTSAIHADGRDHYRADAMLELRGKNIPLTLPFTVHIQGNDAVMDADIMINRAKYEMGQGDDGNAVDNEVRVRIHIEAKRI